jgi:hypothetical protein
MSSTRTLSSTARAALAAVGATGFGLLLAWSWVSATGNPVPHHVEVGVVAPAQVGAQLGATLDAHAPGGFDLVRYPTGQQAASAVKHGDVAGAVVITIPAGSPRLELLTASAAGPIPAQVLTQTFESVAAAEHASFSTTDMVPLPANDRLGATGFLLMLATLVASIVMGASLGLTCQALSRARLVAISAGFAVLIAGADTLLVVAGLGALAGHALAVTGLLALLALAVTLPIAAAARRIGVRALPIAILLLLGLGIPATGLDAGLGQFTPAFFHWIAPALPSSATVSALRDAVYFGGTHLTGSLLGLGCWVAVGLALLVLPGHRGTTAAAETRTAAPAAA